MGTSSRRTSEQIKKLISKAREEGQETSLETLIEPISLQTIRAKRTKQYFGGDAFVVVAGGGLSCAKKVGQLGFEGFATELGIKLKGDPEIDTEQMVQAILDEIEGENEVDSLILNAFKTSFTHYLLMKLDNIEAFLDKFVQTIIKMSIEEQAKEELIAEFNNKSSEDIGNSIDNFASGYVKKNFSDIIHKYSNDKLTSEEFLAAIQEKLK